MGKVQRFIQRNGVSKGQIILFSFSLIILALVLGNNTYNGIKNTYTTNDKAVVIEVGKNGTIMSVSGQLASNNVMAQSRFILYMKLFTDWDVYIKKVYEGTYTIPPHTHIKDLIVILKLDKF